LHQQRGQQNFHTSTFQSNQASASFTSNRSNLGATHQQKIYQGPGGIQKLLLYIRAPRVTLKISGFKQTTFLVDTGSDISLIHEMFIENKNLPKVD